MHHSPVQQLGTCHADTAMKYYNNLPPMGMALSSHVVVSCEWMLQANVDECNYNELWMEGCYSHFKNKTNTLHHK